MLKFQTFKDLNLTFKSHPVTGDVTVKKDEAAIRQSVLSLLYTRKTERVFNSQLGSNLYNLLFEPVGSVTAGLIKQEIEEVLERYEPRISIDQIDVTVDSSGNGFKVLLYFVIVGREDNLLTADLFLESL